MGELLYCYVRLPFIKLIIYSSFDSMYVSIYFVNCSKPFIKLSAASVGLIYAKSGIGCLGETTLALLVLYFETLILALDP